MREVKAQESGSMLQTTKLGYSKVRKGLHLLIFTPGITEHPDDHMGNVPHLYQ